MTRKLIRPILTTALCLCCSLVAAGQPAGSVSPSPPPAGAAEELRELSTMDASETRSELTSLLYRHPSELGTILKLDPTLLSNEGYLSVYPALAAFVEAHPEVAHNPNYFLANVYDPLDRGGHTLENLLEGLAAFAAVTVVVFVFIWLIRTLIEQRRWSHLSKVQTEVHNKLLDRFESNEQLLAYIQSSPGRRFLESAPIPVQTGPASVGAPWSRILWSSQVGIVVAAGAAGLMIVSSRFDDEAGQALSAMGAIGLFVGVGFLISGIASLALSRRLGLWEPGSADAGDDDSAKIVS